MQLPKTITIRLWADMAPVSLKGSICGPRVRVQTLLLDFMRTNEGADWAAVKAALTGRFGVCAAAEMALLRLKKMHQNDGESARAFQEHLVEQAAWPILKRLLRSAGCSPVA